MDLGKNGVKSVLAHKDPKKAKRRSHTLFRLFRICLVLCLLGCCLGAAIGVGMIKGIVDDAPEITLQDVIPSEQKSIIYDSDKKQIQTLVQAGSNRTNIKNYNKIPKDLVNAFVSVEDSRFWTHSGVDPKAIIRAAAVGIMNGLHFTEGGSTITQQLIKNNVFDNWVDERGYGDKIERKIQEQYLALQLEKDPNVSKEDILLSYLNTINCGNNTLGIYQASKRYFGKSYTKLTLSECAVLAAITNSPATYNPITHPAENRKRAQKILNSMEEEGYITAKEHKKALKDLKKSQKKNVYKRIAKINKTYEEQEESVNSYFVDAVIQQVSEALQTEKGYTQAQANNMLYSGGLRIYSTVDSDIQRIIDSEINNVNNYPSEIAKYSANVLITVTYADGTKETFTEISVKQYFRNKDASFKYLSSSKAQLKKWARRFAKSVIDEKKGETYEITKINYTLQPQVSFTIIDQKTGEVKGIAGGRGEKLTNLAYNRAIDSPRQPGSLFKVLAAAAPAIDACGDTLSSVYYDGPYSVGKKEFSNYWSSGYKGYSTIRQALVYSMNIVTLKCMNKTVTPALAFDYLKDFGFTTLVESKTGKDGKIYSDINASLCLGGLTDGVTNLETTAAYAAIANQGTYIKPRFFTKVLDSDGNVILDNTKEKHQVIKKSTAFLLTKAMEECMKGLSYPGSGLTGTGYAANFSGMATAGKTGTTSNTCDYWFAGFTPYYTATVWTGYDEMREIPTDISYHKTIWRKIMSRIHSDLDYKAFKQPKTIVTRHVCNKSGKLATAACEADPRGSMAYTEYYKAGTEPTERCDRHYLVKFCKGSILQKTVDKDGKETVEAKKDDNTNYSALKGDDLKKYSKAKDDCKDTFVRGYMTLGSDADGESLDYQYRGINVETCKIDHKKEEETLKKAEEEKKKKEEEEKKKKEEAKKKKKKKDSSDSDN